MAVPSVRSLRQLVRSKYEEAKQTGALSFSETQLALVSHPRSHTVFQVRFCPSLGKKPVVKQEALGINHVNKKAFNPFESPSADLLVATYPFGDSSSVPTHNLVLNKFPIISEHFILSTSSFKQQTDPLEADDLAAAYACLRAWDEGATLTSNRDSAALRKPAGNGDLFAFFNSGPDSGASQPHRHVQFVPVSAMAEGTEWKPLLEQINTRTLESAGSDASLPFDVKIEALKADPTPADLLAAYKTLLRIAFNLPSMEEVNHAFTNRVSYNLAMTTSVMAVCRRRSGDYIHVDESGSEREISINGTLLAGTVLVKGDAEWNWLKTEPEALDTVLASIVSTDQKEVIAKKDRL